MDGLVTSFLCLCISSVYSVRIFHGHNGGIYTLFCNIPLVSNQDICFFSYWFAGAGETVLSSITSGSFFKSFVVGTSVDQGVSYQQC